MTDDNISNISKDKTLYTSVSDFYSTDSSDTVVPTSKYKSAPAINEIPVLVMKDFETDPTQDCDHELNKKFPDPVNDSSPEIYSAPKAKISKTSPVLGPNYATDESNPSPVEYFPADDPVDTETPDPVPTHVPALATHDTNTSSSDKPHSNILINTSAILAHNTVPEINPFQSLLIDLLFPLKSFILYS